ncbi:MAG: ATP-binding protein [Aquabacterium sp.]|nr:ATP-binding protein [Aquabacterium sp.]
MHSNRAPGRLFWKVFAACWFTAMLTGLGIHLIARTFPGWIELPPVPPSPQQSVLLPMATGATIALVLSAMVAWSLSRPLRLLRLAFADAAAGQLERRVAPMLGRQRDEFAALARDFDRMAEQLQALLGSQQRLLHDVSHELRSPLARLQVAAALLQRSPESLPQALLRIEREVRRLDDLVAQVLMLARLESSAPLADVREVDVMALLACVVDDARFEARSQHRDVRLTTPCESLAMRANGELLLRAFDNAVRNAVRHTAPGTVVEVMVQLCTPARLRVEVADRGPGLPPEAMERVFEPFERLPTARANTGVGLGLAITRRAVLAHGGCTRAQARAGGGLCIVFELPVEVG